MPSPRSASPELQSAMDEVAEAVNRTIERLLPETDLAEAPLYEAMRHGTLSGGKRLRHILSTSCSAAAPGEVITAQERGNSGKACLCSRSKSPSAVNLILS